MLKEKKVYIYEYKEGFYVEIEKDKFNILSGFWLYHEEYGIKMLMFELEYKKDPEILIKNNIEHYIKIYKKEVMHY